MHGETFALLAEWRRFEHHLIGGNGPGFLESTEEALTAMDFLPCVEIEPDAPADAAVIWLHGLGADGHDFEPIVPELRLPKELAVRFVFPRPRFPSPLTAE